MNILRNIINLICGDPPKPVDVAQMLDDLASQHTERLDWRHSIVDLLKLLALDSSLEARKQLARELGCPDSDPHDTMLMNQWLHHLVMQKLTENGGKIPDDMRA